MGSTFLVSAQRSVIGLCLALITSAAISPPSSVSSLVASAASASGLGLLRW